VYDFRVHTYPAHAAGAAVEGATVALVVWVAFAAALAYLYSATRL
jgi:hypothetical protein